MMAIKAPYLPYDALRDKAVDFLATHHPSGDVPVPIVEIVDFQLQMDIVGIPGLQDSLEIDSCISSDLATIYIDEFVLNKRPARYRFSVAHELSHRLIHGEIFQQLSFHSLKTFKLAINSIDPKEYGWLELQAYNLAGLILVPSSKLDAAFRTCEDEAAKAGISFQDADAEAADIVCANIGRDFAVSGAVVRKRLRLDGLVDWESRIRH